MEKHILTTENINGEYYHKIASSVGGNKPSKRLQVVISIQVSIIMKFSSITNNFIVLQGNEVKYKGTSGFNAMKVYNNLP